MAISLGIYIEYTLFSDKPILIIDTKKNGDSTKKDKGYEWKLIWLVVWNIFYFS